MDACRFTSKASQSDCVVHLLICAKLLHKIRNIGTTLHDCDALAPCSAAHHSDPSRRLCAPEGRAPARGYVTRMLLPHPGLRAAAAAFAIAFAPAASAAHDAASPDISISPTTARSAPTAAMNAQARAEYEAFLRGEVDRTKYSYLGAKTLDDAMVARTSQHLRSHGAIRRFAFAGLLDVEGQLMYTYRVSPSTGPDLLELIAWDGDGKIRRVIFGDAP